MTHKIDREGVRRIARLAHLEFPRVQNEEGTWVEPREHLVDDEVLDRLADDMEQILDYVGQLSEANVDGVKPTSHGVPLPTSWREDEAKASGFDRDRALEAAPALVGDAVSVPKAIQARAPQDTCSRRPPRKLQTTGHESLARDRGVMDLLDRSLAGAAALLEDGRTTSLALTEACLARIHETEELNAFITVDGDAALAAAERSDQRRKKQGAVSPLDGIPIALKDLLITEGTRTTAGSRILSDYVPPYDGTMSRRLKEAGAVLVGKTNLDEFAMGSSNEFSSFGPVKNPWNPSCVPGGSSGGSAAAVAARQVFGALGTDTGGSIRQPASFCGIYGLKPTYSRVSRLGVIAFASSLDQVGPFGRSAKDIALLLAAIAGYDHRDSTASAHPVPDYAATLHDGVAGLRVGIPREYFVEGLDDEVQKAIETGIAQLKEAGATTVDISLPHTKYAIATYYIICTAEASSNLARYDGVRYGERAEERELRRMYAASRFAGFGEEARRRIMLGTYVLSAGYYEEYYGRAQKVRTLIRRDFEEALSEVDLIATPVSPCPAFAMGERVNDPLSMYLADLFTIGVNLAGIPGLSVPVGFSACGLPIGLQLLGRWFEEATLLRAAQVIENATDVAKQVPVLGA